ncbi:hypothetical protein V2A60_005516 [Cordyceps javanica]
MRSNDPQRKYNGEMAADAGLTVKLWDGHKRTARHWNGLHREPELWSANGNCLIHLYGKGQCNAGPSFRVDFATLVKKQCHTFINMYIDQQGPAFELPKTDSEWNRLCLKRRVSLYVPAVPGCTRSELLRQHLSVRNFLAWTAGLPLVGTHLGEEIVTLFQSMDTYRSLGADSIADLLAYLDAAGYMNIVAQPDHALASLYAAELLRHQDLYTRAFVHCVGMGERIYRSTEYTKISLVSRRLIRDACQELKCKISSAIEDLGSFLEEELSESRIGFPAGLRVHLDSFRSALWTFYTAKFGYFPPRDFDAKVIQAMSEDFEALHDLLVDDGAGTAGMFGGTTGGGLCILQIIRAFDSRNSFDTRPHPLPLLPATSEARKSRRVSWLGRGEMGKPANRLAAHAALMKASNWREPFIKNGLVRLYCDFEGKSLQPSLHKGAKPEDVSITDARKVRWILIYAMCQVLRSISRRAPQVAGEQAPYFLSASVAELPPWNTGVDATTMDLPISSRGLPTMPPSADEPWQPKFVGGVEIKPDIDYFALTRSTERQQPDKLRRWESVSVSQAAASPANASSGIVFTRRSSIRDSIRRRLRPGTAGSGTTAASPPRKTTHHEIVVQGYGNGTNEVKLGRRNTVGCDHFESGRRPSTVLPSDSRDMSLPAVVFESIPIQSRRSSNRSSNASFAATMDSPAESDPGSPATIATPELEQNGMEPVIVRNSSHKSLTQRYPMKSVLESISRTSSKRRASLAGAGGREQPPSMPPPQLQQPPSLSLSGSLSRAPSLRKSLLPESWTLAGRPTFVEHDIDEEDEFVSLQSEADEWIAMQAFLDGDDVSGTPTAHERAAPGWEQYNDLGGLIEV